MSYTYPPFNAVNESFGGESAYIYPLFNAADLSFEEIAPIISLLKYWNGTTWDNTGILKYWNGTTWVSTATLKYWDGTTWVAATGSGTPVDPWMYGDTDVDFDGIVYDPTWVYGDTDVDF